MKKHIFDLASRGVMNRAPASLGPGMLRVAAAEDSSKADVYIYGDIGGWWDGGVLAEEFVRDMRALDVGEVHAWINSPGGVVFDGVAIYDELARQKSKVIVHIDGIAASIASIIAMAGDEIQISEASNVMIHKPWSFVVGDDEAMDKEAAILRELKDGLVDIYVARTGQKRSDIDKWVAAETWFRGQKAVDHGFADVLVPSKKKPSAHARSAMLMHFKNAPQDLLSGDAVTGSREFERLLREGEGFSHAQAKRVVAMAKSFNPEPRDEVLQHTPRDGGVSERLAAFLRTL